MQMYVGPILLCALAGLLSTFIWQRKVKVREGIVPFFRDFCFFLFSYLGVMSMVKSLLGCGMQTLYESFSDIEASTYVHYGLPLGFLALFFPVIIYKLFKAEFIKTVVDNVVSLMVIVILLLFVTFEEVYNLYYVLIFAGCVIGAFVIVSLKDRIIKFIPKQERKASIRYAGIGISFWCITTVIYMPIELFLTNYTEFPFDFGNLFKAVVLQTAGTVIVFMLISTCLLSSRQLDFLGTMIFSLTMSVYIQALILNGQLQVMDGVRENWPITKIIINCVVWLAIVSVLIGLKYILKKVNMTKVYSYICVYFCLIQIVSMGYLIISTYSDIKMDANDKAQITKEGMLDLTPENNVIVFVLDWYDEQILEEIVANDSDFLNPLNDFTWYTNSTCMYGFTGMSVPYLLTGNEWVYDMKDDEYCEYAHAQGTYLRELVDKQYTLGIYTEDPYVKGETKAIITNITNDIKAYCSTEDIIKLMTKCARYKCYPFVFKELYWYSADDIWELKDKNELYSYDQMEFYEELVRNNIRIDSETEATGTFRFYHLNGAHAPYTIDDVPQKTDNTDIRLQSKGSMKIVYEYLRQLQELGIYDDATIIITADHGNNYSLDATRKQYADEMGLEETCNPILLVKRAGQNQKTVKISDAPVTHKECLATIVDEVGGDSEKYGRTLEDIGENETRDRVFIFRRQSRKMDDIPYAKYIIRGDARDFNNWFLEN